MPDIDSTAVSGVEVGGYRRGAGTGDPWHQYVVPVRDRISSFKGRGSSFRVPSRAAVTQNVLTIFNTSATVVVSVNRMLFDMYSLVPAAATVHPPIVRVSRIAAAATGGTAVAKAAMDTAGTSDAAVAVLADASADGTSSGTSLTATLGATLTQEIGPRLINVGTGTANALATELADRMTFFHGDPDVVLRQNQGLALHLVWQAAPAAGAAAAGHHFTAVVDWEEYTRP